MTILAIAACFIPWLLILLYCGKVLYKYAKAPKGPRHNKKTSRNQQANTEASANYDPQLRRQTLAKRRGQRRKPRNRSNQAKLPPVVNKTK